jgi:hypothetical protein
MLRLVNFISGGKRTDGTFQVGIRRPRNKKANWHTRTQCLNKRHSKPCMGGQGKDFLLDPGDAARANSIY